MTAGIGVMTLVLAGAAQATAAEPSDATIRPGEGRIVFASKVSIDGFGGIVGKSIC